MSPTHLTICALGKSNRPLIRASLHTALKTNNSSKEKNRGVLQSAKNTLLFDCWLATQQHGCTEGFEKKNLQLRQLHD